MTNFIFKSQGTYKKLANNMEVLLNEQRNQRQDLAALLYLVKQIKNDLSLENQAMKHYDDSERAPSLVQDSHDLD